MELTPDSDDDFEHVSHYAMSGSDSGDEIDFDGHLVQTPISTPAASTPKLEPPCREKRLKCPRDNCDKAFNRPVKLEQHLRSHDNVRTFKCPHAGCSKDYLRDTHLQHHIKSAHSKKRDYKCSWKGCDKVFLTGTRLRRHVEAHEGQERYRCRGYEGCDETFRKKDTLQRHIVSVHENKKPFQCDETDLNTGEQCSKAFDSAERLRHHQQVNHDPARFSCDICVAANSASLAADPFGDLESLQPAFFATYHDLQEHNSIVHPPTCQQCLSAFGTNKELTRHLEVAHGVLPAQPISQTMFDCPRDGCDKSYNRKGNLNAHIKRVHDKPSAAQDTDMAASLVTEQKPRRKKISRIDELVGLENATILDGQWYVEGGRGIAVGPVIGGYGYDTIDPALLQ